MKETKSRNFTMEQKIYTVLVAGGICALIAVSILYGLEGRKTNDLVEQNFELSEDNPVSGQVSDVELDVPEEVSTENTATEPVEQTTERKAEETMKFTGFDGSETLAWPVEGIVLIPYSMDTTVYFETLDQYQCNPAVYMKAQPGENVKSVSEGQVKTLKNDSRYGQMVVVDMGNGYRAYYGQLKDVKVKEGDILKKDMVIGNVAEPTEYYALEGSHLYLKMTKNGKEVNPVDYFTP